jgi:hypothetical protein
MNYISDGLAIEPRISADSGVEAPMLRNFEALLYRRFMSKRWLLRILVNVDLRATKVTSKTLYNNANDFLFSAFQPWETVCHVSTILNQIPRTPALSFECYCIECSTPHLLPPALSQGERDYSVLSATSGSTFVARLAGM